MTWTWLGELVFPSLVANGTFGPGCRYLSFKPAGRPPWTSTVVYGKVLVAGVPDEHSVVLKVKHRCRKMRHVLKCDMQFHNEIAAYEKILPFLVGAGVAEDYGCLFAKYYYGRNACGKTAEQDVIVLKDMRTEGYELFKDSLFLDYDHVVAALRALGKFHGMSYVAKSKNPLRFRELSRHVLDTQWDAEGRWIFGDAELRTLAMRGVRPLMERPGYDDGRMDACLELLASAERNLRRVMRSDGRWSVLCHGGFCRDNLMFRYDVVTGRPTHVLPFDLAGIRCGSPALDLSFFLYMNTDNRLRENRWEDLLDVYHEAVSQVGAAEGVAVPVRDDLDAEMKTHALYGLAHVSYLLALTARVPDDHDMVSECKREFDMATDQEKVNLSMDAGGQASTDLLMDVVKHIVDKGYTKKPL
ncbi:uncharacterized protein LOC126847537 [Adelges cooleyi]|uniref:uncharacterized protein LOC126847537 n=1 Tax=Adelges cooleyi TaxID=133065 RepID=UPI0021808003|nr:uncharacterized protein LOC126847537 [Adelges cooleyi]